MCESMKMQGFCIFLQEGLQKLYFVILEEFDSLAYKLHWSRYAGHLIPLVPLYC